MLPKEERTVTVEITESEAQIIPMLRAVRLLDLTLENADKAFRIKLIADNLIDKVQKAFGAEPEQKPEASPEAQAQVKPAFKPKRKRH